MLQLRTLAGVVAGAVLCLAPAMTHAQSTGSDPVLTDRIDRFVRASQVNGVVPGAIGVWIEGEPVYQAFFGEADRRTGRGFDADTLFDIGSLTKQFTAAAILVLVDRGQLSLDDRLADHFDGVPADKADIAIDQLLSHSSGLSDDTGGFQGHDADPFVSEADFMAAVLASPLTSAPGTRHEYTNAGYSVLASIIERVSGQDYETFLREALFEPAGLQSTGYRLMDWSEGQAARGYNYRQPDPSRADTGWFFLERWREEPVTWHLRGNGGLHSTMADLERWHRALQEDRILSAHSRALFEAPHIPSGFENAPGFTHYGYGWAVGTSPDGTRVLSHNGGNSIFFASIHRYPEEDILVLHLTNEASREIERMGYAIRHMLFDADYQPAPITPYSIRAVANFTAQYPADAVDRLPAWLEESGAGPIEDSWVLNRLGFHLLDEGQTDWAIALLEWNTRLFPGDGNLQDSLATAYARAGQETLALRHYRLSLELDPGEGGCHWCENARQEMARLTDE
ncbi:serine hydrolase domain-containing protein [Maricaulis parjimensis]|uniref:serine hydrolase domain-containing protein n=1 Tax=Maricaulis parjimensis TaxID=144023 RepID=UPI00193989FA|nr:serine hydrolase domain-containing protein [Maricaulis parjimensis]